MKKILTFLLTFLAPLWVIGQTTGGLDQRINEAFSPISDAITSVVFYPVSIAGIQVPIVVLLLLTAATVFTIYFKFINFTGFAIAVKTVRGTYDDIDHHEANVEHVHAKDGDIVDTIKIEGKEGEVSHFQALTAALSGTVGLGNIAGVAVAVSMGGPGATFWMVLAGFLGMASKFTECTLGVKFRDVGVDGTVYGGPMYYLSKGLKQRGKTGLGKVLAVVFAICCVGGSFGGGNMFQANQAAQQFNDMMGFDSGFAGATFGAVMAILVAIVIIGGIKRIGSVTEKVVPFMVGIYVVAAFVILFTYMEDIPWAFGQILSGAFSPKGITGGMVGVLIVGMRRAAFSNEAGVGSAAIAHSAVKTKYPASEGVVALLEPFIDTVVVCTMTALVIIIANGHADIMTYGNAVPDGVEATSRAFASVIPWFPYVLTLAVVLFALSTMLSWSYYGLQSWMYLFGRNKAADYSYKILFCIFIVIGSAASLGAVIDFSDAMIFAMAVPNLIGLFLLLPVVRQELDKYIKAIKNAKG